VKFDIDSEGKITPKNSLTGSHTANLDYDPVKIIATNGEKNPSIFEGKNGNVFSIDNEKIEPKPSQVIFADDSQAFTQPELYPKSFKLTLIGNGSSDKDGRVLKQIKDLIEGLEPAE